MNFYYPEWNCLMRHLITVCGSFSRGAAEDAKNSIDIIPAVFIEHQLHHLQQKLFLY